MSDPNWIQISSLDDVAQFRARPTIFLSASVPYLRSSFPPEIDSETRAENADFVKTSKERLIQGAVAAFAREIVIRDHRIVFGAHPAISPMLLTALRDADRGEVLIFQSELFRKLVPDSTFELAKQANSQLVFTDVRPALNVPANASGEYKQWLERKASLTFMRQCMASVPGLHAAVFLGGMDGTIEEGDIVWRRPGLANSCYAYAATGAAARRLFDDPNQNFRGQLAPQILEDDLSPSLALHEIFADIDKTRAPGAQP